MKVTEVAADVTGLEITSLLCRKAGECSWFETRIGMADMSFIPSNVTATVRVFRFSACAVKEVVTPVAMVIVQMEPIASVAVPAVSLSFVSTPS